MKRLVSEPCNLTGVFEKNNRWCNDVEFGLNPSDVNYVIMVISFSITLINE
ncbi:MAG: hypothetical protein U0V04_01955 [Spirosomataceae bacterium]